MTKGKSNRIKTKNVASIAVFNQDGQILFGQRQDNQKYSFAGGHMEPHESPSQAALRELFEETGLVPIKDIEFIGDGKIPNKDIHVYAFKCTVNGEPTSENDPDEEFGDNFQWVNPNNIPEDIINNLHSPKNVVLAKLGLQEDIFKYESKHWICQDSRIPVKNNPKRAIWDEIYLTKCQDTFIKKNQESIECYVDISKVNGYNTAINKNRVNLYKRMLKSEDEIPIVVLKYDSDGLNLIDGNHRQEACLQSGVNIVKALVIVNSTLNKSEAESLEKASILAPLFASGLLMASPAQKPMPTLHSITQGTGIKTWSPEGLDKDLYPIAHLESSFGKNISHEPHSGGEYYSAFGALGMKPVVGHESYKKSPVLQKEYPGLFDPADFTKVFKTDPQFYNKVANKHFNILKSRHGDLSKAVFAWRFGSGAAKSAHSDVINKDPYVSKYNQIKGK